MPVVKEGSIGKVGRAIYNQEIRHKVESTEKGKVVVIDVTSGDYEIDCDDWAATLRLMERRPDALTWAERVSYPAVHTMGFSFPPSYHEDA